MSVPSDPFDTPPDPNPEVQPAAPRRAVQRLKRIATWSALAAGGMIAATAAYLCVLVYTTPQVDDLRRAQALRPSVILSSDGEVIGRFSTLYQAPVTLKEVPPDLIRALIATEDHRFYDHYGIDPTRIVGSAWGILNGRMAGASTLTQQLARNLFPQQIGNEISLNRKLREAITALRMERSSTKEQILESYLNSAPFLYNVRGIEMAARTYFDKPASQLDTAQCATLVGMLKGTGRYNPVRNPERARDRRNVVMAQMVKHGALQPARYEQLRAQPLVLAFKRPEDGDIGQARHFVAHLREQLVEWADAHDVDLDTDGLVIRTTLDAKLQRVAQDAVAQQVALLQRIAGEEWSEARPRPSRINAPAVAKAATTKGAAPAEPFAYFWQRHPELQRELARDTAPFRAAKQAGESDAQALAAALADTDAMARVRDERTRLSAGFIAIDPASGAVRAWVGSPDFAREQFDHVAQARRQPGSTFKPFVYGAALQRGMSTERQYLDGAIDIALADGGVWQPTDRSGPSGEKMTLREGLVQSKNTITAQVMQEVGVEAVANFAQAAGVRESKLDMVPSLALGTSPVTLLEMGNAYATLASLGERRRPLLITQIADRNGRVLETFEVQPEPVLDRALVEKLVDVMRGVVQTGTGAAIRSEWGVRGDLAGKTGTTQNNTDGWFMLMSPTLVAGAWVGFNDPRVTIRSNYWGQGGHNALRLVGAFMKQGQKAKLIDAKAEFPQVVRDAPEAPALPASSAEGDGMSPPSQTPFGAWLGLPALRAPPPPAETAADRQMREQALGR